LRKLQTTGIPQYTSHNFEIRKNEMVMLEEFRRRKNLERYYKMTTDKLRMSSNDRADPRTPIDVEKETMTREMQHKHSGPERFFTPEIDEIFDPSKFALIFLDSDSVTNVTALNRVNHRRVLLFIGNMGGVISYAMGKSDDYEKAFEQAFKKLR
jgi:hypothetical protein